MIVLGLDLQGTRLGWAVLVGTVLQNAGCVHLGARMEPGARAGTQRKCEVRGLRALDLRTTLRHLLDTWAPDVVAYEKVRHHGPGQVESAHGWGAAEMAVLEVLALRQAEQRAAGVTPIELREVGVQAGKLALTGSGAAPKAQMSLAAAKRWPSADIDWWAGDHDAADAVGVALAIVAPVASKAARAKQAAAERRAARGAA